jgi:hypothetical protein
MMAEPADGKVDAADGKVDAAEAVPAAPARDDSDDLGDSPWLVHFVRTISSDAVVFPSPEERAARDAAWTASLEARAAWWDSLDEAARQQQHDSVRAFVASFAANLASHVPAALESLPTAPQAVEPRSRSLRRLLPLIDTSHVAYQRPPDPACPHAAVAQVNVYQQIKNPSCGYHSLHNGLTCVEALLYAAAKDQAQKKNKKT